ncbi:MAG: chemotaxis protein [bacterium]|nr:chemotaxis protein [bacterium]
MATPSTSPAPAPGPQVILLNGPSSAGKTTIARALQARIAEPFLRLSFDDFVFAHAARYYRGADGPARSETNEWIDEGCRIVTTSAPGEPPAVRAEFGPVFRRTFAAIGPTVRTLVATGSRVILDHVIADEWMYDSWLEACGDLDVLRVGVTCALPILESRERARGDRVLGRARGLVSVVHTFTAYDVVVDSGAATVDQCVEAIVRAARLRTCAAPFSAVPSAPVVSG